MILGRLILVTLLWLTALWVARRAGTKGTIAGMVWVVLACSGMALLTFCAASCSQPEPRPAGVVKPATDPRDAGLIISWIWLDFDLDLI